MAIPSDPPPVLAERRLYNIAEAASYLNVPQRWVAEAVRTHRIRCTRIGKHVRFRPEHLDELIDAGEQPVLAATSLSVIPQRRASTGRSRL